MLEWRSKKKKKKFETKAPKTIKQSHGISITIYLQLGKKRRRKKYVRNNILVLQDVGEKKSNRKMGKNYC